MRFGMGLNAWTGGGRGFGGEGRGGRRGPGGFGGPGGPGGPREGGRGRRRLFDGGELRLVLLKLIAESPRHGYDLIRAIEELTGGAYAPSPGVIYPTITMLGDMGLIAEQKGDGSRKAFAITDEGAKTLDAQAEAVEALFARMAALGERAQRGEGGAPIKRAMINLRIAVQQRLSRDDTGEETLHAAAAILDEAAQRIERL